MTVLHLTDRLDSIVNIFIVCARLPPQNRKSKVKCIPCESSTDFFSLKFGRQGMKTSSLIDPRKKKHNVKLASTFFPTIEKWTVCNTLNLRDNRHDSLLLVEYQNFTFIYPWSQPVWAAEIMTQMRQWPKRKKKTEIYKRSLMNIKCAESLSLIYFPQLKSRGKIQNENDFSSVPRLLFFGTPSAKERAKRM